MKSNQKNVRDSLIHIFLHYILYVSVPLMAEIQMKISETGIWQSNLSGAVATLTEGLVIEQAQYVVDLTTKNTTKIGL